MKRKLSVYLLVCCVALGVAGVMAAEPTSGALTVTKTSVDLSASIPTGAVQTANNSALLHEVDHVHQPLWQQDLSHLIALGDAVQARIHHLQGVLVRHESIASVDLQGIHHQLVMMNQSLQSLGVAAGVTQRVPASLVQQTSSAIQFWSVWRHANPTYMFLLMAFVILSLLVCLFYFWARQKRLTRLLATYQEPLAAFLGEGPRESVSDDPVDYDYLGSRESIPAKLDLVRAYLAMEDYELAQAVLEQVRPVADEAQSAEVEALAEQLKSDLKR